MKLIQENIGEGKLWLYLLDSSPELRRSVRPLILICPGGGYGYTSDREAEPLAMRYLAMGYHAAVLRYSVAPAVYPTAPTQLAQAVALIRGNAQVWQVNPRQIFLLGCSAGGHLAASLGVHWHKDWLSQAAGTSPEEIRPTGLILCYPVITAGEFANQESFQNLLPPEASPELRREVSLETQVTPHTPPVFLWHTVTDTMVPVENALLLAEALRKNRVSMELHLYEQGVHGLSTADETAEGADGYGLEPACQNWIDLSHTWLQRQLEKNP